MNHSGATSLFNNIVRPEISFLGDMENVRVSLLREDKIHQYVSGNKFRKLTYNFQEAIQVKSTAVLTFGGAYSNHIAATASAGKMLGVSTIGVIRGEELAEKVAENPTLSFARSCGMKLHFISREMYKEKHTLSYRNKLKSIFGEFYCIPEGGTNALAIKGCEEILNPNTSEYDYICVSVGTGGTISGIINASLDHQKIIGFSALKGTFQKKEIQKFIHKNNYELLDDYSFGGYAKIDRELVRFINRFKKDTAISLDPVYTGKMMFGIYDLISNGYFEENSRILAIHTGGLQGIEGMNTLLKKKNLPQIDI